MAFLPDEFIRWYSERDVIRPDSSARPEPFEGNLERLVGGLAFAIKEIKGSATVGEAAVTTLKLIATHMGRKDNPHQTRANQIPVIDAGNHFAATEVDAALAEEAQARKTHVARTNQNAHGETPQSIGAAPKDHELKYHPDLAGAQNGNVPIFDGVTGAWRPGSPPSGGSGGYVSTAFLQGLEVTWVSTSQVKVLRGAAFVPGANKVVETLGEVSPAMPVLAANTWYFVYLWDNAGVPALEVSTVAPAAPYLGGARVKGGASGATDNTRRYVGSFRTNANALVRKFDRQGASVWWLPAANQSETEFVISNATSTAFVQGWCGGHMPPTSKRVFARVLNNSGTLFTIISNSEASDPFGVSSVPPKGFGIVPFPTDARQNVQAKYYPDSPTDGGFYLMPLGYEEVR